MINNSLKPINDENNNHYSKKIDCGAKTTEDNGIIKRRRRVLLLTNNPNAMVLYHWLLKNDDIAYLHSGELTIDQLASMRLDMIISYNYKYLIREDAISFMQGQIINLHTSYLPWNRGCQPNFWSFVEGTPKGVTIHWVDKGFDTGDILCQRLIKLDEKHETFNTSYNKLNREITSLFAENWDAIKNNKIKAYKQDDSGTYHSMLDFTRFTELHPVNWDDNIDIYKRRIAQVKL